MQGTNSFFEQRLKETFNKYDESNHEGFLIKTDILAANNKTTPIPNWE